MSDFEAKKQERFLTEATYDELAAWFPETFADKEVDEIIYGDDEKHAKSLSWVRCFQRVERLVLCATPPAMKLLHYAPPVRRCLRSSLGTEDVSRMEHEVLGT